MDIRHLPAQLELTFWSLAIPMMGRSKLLVRLIQAVYDIRLNRFAFPALLLVGSILGVSIGFLIGLLFGG